MISTIFATLFLFGGTWLALTANTDPDQLATGIFFAAFGAIWLIIKQISKVLKTAKKEA